MIRRVAVALAAVALAATAGASSLTIDTGTYAGTTPDINWWGQAFYLNDQGGPGVGVPMSGNLSLFDSYSTRVDNVEWSTLGGSWQGQYVSTLAWDTCYSTGFNAQTFDQFGQKYGSTTCNPKPPSGSPGGGGHLIDCFASPDGTDTCSEPILFNLGDGPYRLSGLDDPVSFDIHADGQRLKIGWTARNASVAFLALDRNGNGKIDDGAELFGNATPLAGGARAANGFEALARYDANGDGAIDAADPVWTSLLLWTDRNHDGVSQPDELQPIAVSEITRILLDHQWTGRRDASGNRFGYQGRARTSSGFRVFYDVFFVTERP